MKKLFYQLIAAITFFTRIPLGRLIRIPAESFTKIICFWPLTGWITGAVTAFSWLGFSMYFPSMLSIILALVVRVLFTGGFHEDGLVDFFDGFGGGRTKPDILRIMKDSQVGSYALIGMIIYYLLMINALYSISDERLFFVLLIADPLSKLFTTVMMNFLPYARTESESKSKTLYDKLSAGRLMIACVSGLAPLFLFHAQHLWISALLPLSLVLFMYFYVRKKIGGYTGDICGATALLCELVFFLGVCLLN
jgi:adenosylcobinamide-GDP ribazoletransferase